MNTAKHSEPIETITKSLRWNLSQ